MLYLINTSKMNTFTPIISEALGLSQRGVENTLQLLDENCTIPFISRYRKEMTGNMDEVQGDESLESVFLELEDASSC